MEERSEELSIVEAKRNDSSKREGFQVLLKKKKKRLWWRKTDCWDDAVEKLINTWQIVSKLTNNPIYYVKDKWQNVIIPVFSKLEYLLMQLTPSYDAVWKKLNLSILVDNIQPRSTQQNLEFSSEDHL